MQSEQEGRFGAKSVGAAFKAVPATEPAVAQEHLYAVGSAVKVAGNVPLKNLQPLAVGREPRDQLFVPNPVTVQENLDDAVGRCGEGCRVHVVGQLNIEPEDVGGAGARAGVGGFVGADPPRAFQHRGEGHFRPHQVSHRNSFVCVLPARMLRTQGLWESMSGCCTDSMA